MPAGMRWDLATFYWDLLGKERSVRSGWLLSPRRHYFDHVSPVLQSTRVSSL